MTTGACHCLICFSGDDHLDIYNYTDLTCNLNQSIMACSVGEFLNSACSTESTSSVAEVGITLPVGRDLELLKKRTGFEGVTTVCTAHRLKYLKIYEKNQRTCCDPAKLHKSKVTASLRGITLQEADQYSWFSLVPGKKWCTGCRKYAKKTEEECLHVGLSSSSSETEQPELDPPGGEQCSPDQITVVNTSLQSLGESPFLYKRLHQKRYPEEKLEKIQLSIRKRLKLESKKTDPEEDEDIKQARSYYNEMITQLKQKFRETTKRSDKMQILSVLPSSWSIKTIQEEFNVSNFMARSVKRLVKEKGIFSTPNPKPGKLLSEATVKAVQDFYKSDDISRQMPGMKDCVSVVENNVKVSVQKRLMLCNIDESFRCFKEQHPSLKIGFSKFAELRPKNVVLPGASGTHSVCVCTIHQNTKLMMLGARIPSLKEFKGLVDESFNGEVKYQHLLSSICCNPPQTSCFFRECSNCEKMTETLAAKLEEVFDRVGYETITFKSWVSVDRTTLETIQKNSDDFISTFTECLIALLRHDFLARQQSMFLKQTKNSGTLGEVIVICDFAENYSFVLQDAAQGFHWTNTQATDHPFVIYYHSQEDGSSELKHISYVVISDCLVHDTVTVHCFQKNLIEFSKSKIPVTKVIYFSDGAASQYKNRKKFLNLALHETDFGMAAEWHFFATSHGKGPCDGVGGTVKRLAARASLQRPYTDQIMDPLDLYTWAKENISKVIFSYVSTAAVEEERILLTERFQTSVAIHGTLKLHAFYPHDGRKTEIVAKEHSNSLHSIVAKVDSKAEPLTWRDICGYVICTYDHKWWLAQVLEKFPDKEEVKVSFLHPSGPAPSFYFPLRPDDLIISRETIVKIVEPTTETGRVFKLPPGTMWSDLHL